MIPDVIKITSAKYQEDYSIHIQFDDGTSHVVDFGPFLLSAVHPDIRAYLEIERFKSFHIENGELLWGDYDLCFPVIDLYNNTILHRTAVGGP